MKRFTSWLRQQKAGFSRPTSGHTNYARAQWRPSLETLEDRVTPANVALSIPSNLNVVQGGVVAVPVQFAALTDGLGNQGMFQADVAINYDPSVLTVSGADIFQGTALASVASLLTVTPSFASGQIELSITSPTSPIASVSGPGGTQPITVTTTNPLPPGLNANDNVTISGVTGFPAANGSFGIAVTGANTFTLNNTNGDSGSSSGSGTWAPIIGSPGATNDSLVVIDFHAQGGAALGSSSLSLVTSNSLGVTDLFAGTTPHTAYGLSLTSGSVNVLPAASAPALGFFTPVTNISTIGAGNGIGTMLLLTDGSIMADVGGDGDSTQWYRLTPDTSGNYSDGTWHNLANSNIGRLFFGSVVLQNGDVMVLGGEDTNIGGPIASVVGTATGLITVTTQNPLPTDLSSGSVSITGVTGFPSSPTFNINGGFNFTVTGTNTFTLAGTTGTVGSSNPNTGSFSVGESNAGEIFTPPTTPTGMGSWHNIAPFPLPTFGDSSLELLSDGTVLAGPNSSNAAYRYNPALDPILNPSLPATDNPWSLDAAQSAGVIGGVTNSETGWTKLPDGSILTYQLYGFARFGVGGGLVSNAAAPQTGAAS